MSAIAALSCVSQPRAAPHGLCQRRGKAELQLSGAAPNARLSPAHNPSDAPRPGERRQRRGEEVRGAALPEV